MCSTNHNGNNNTTAIGVLITDTNSSVFTIMESTAASPRKGKKPKWNN
jgi:hypothetical protein